jgi:hypothetical protein
MGVVDGAAGAGELAWVAGAVVAGTVIAGAVVAGAVVAGAAVAGALVVGVWVDAAWAVGGDEPQADRLPARIAAAAMAIGNLLMPHPLVCQPVMSRSQGLSCRVPATQRGNTAIAFRMAWRRGVKPLNPPR